MAKIGNNAFLKKNVTPKIRLLPQFLQHIIKFLTNTHNQITKFSSSWIFEPTSQFFRTANSKNFIEKSTLKNVENFNFLGVIKGGNQKPGFKKLFVPIFC